MPTAAEEYRCAVDVFPVQENINRILSICLQGLWHKA